MQDLKKKQKPAKPGGANAQDFEAVTRPDIGDTLKEVKKAETLAAKLKQAEARRRNPCGCGGW